MKTTRYQLVESIKPASQVGAGSRLYFLDQPQLRTMAGHVVQILSIEAFSAETVPVSPSGITVSDEAAFKNAVLVLNVDGYENLQFIPLPRINNMQVNTDTVPFTQLQMQFYNLYFVDWTKSYIQFAAAPAASRFSYLFGVSYLLLPADNNISISKLL